MHFTFVLFSLVVIVMVLIMVFFLVMYYCAIWNIKVTELRVFIGCTDINATQIILVREVMGLAIIYRLSL